MNNFLRYSALMFFLSFAIKAYPSERIFPCAPAKEVMKKNMQDGYAYLATATEQHGFVIQIYLNLKNGNWKLIGIDKDLSACTMLQGYDWQSFLVRSM